MKVFKFGGASVKDADSVQNVARILKLFPKDNLIVVISAMGKTTNSLEKLAEAFYYKRGNVQQLIGEIKKYHFDIIQQIFPDKTHSIYNEINNTFVELDWATEGEPSNSFDHVYDQIACIGEIISTKIVSAYLNSVGLNNKWEDVRDFIKTDDTYREGKVDWESTEGLTSILSKATGVVVTQGFIGGTSENYTTTLGREGSDYTAAILAYCTNAESVTIWKDVPGVLNADPKWFDDTQLIQQLSYQDAIELAYYGATVIHPKTIKPLQNKHIPLYVRSFINPEEKGTIINDVESHLPVPCFIFKVNQVLLSISPKDFSFIVEQNLSDIFKLFAEQGVKINTMQSTAISFSVCVDINEHKIPTLVKELQNNYRVLYNDGLELITIRYYNQATIDRVTVDKKILLEVKSRYTVQLVVKNK
jgi:aspartate kinase